jgi:hypothetical protein
VAIHEVERELAAFLSPDEYVDAYLSWAAAQLRTINKPDAIALADTIVRSLEATVTDATRESVGRGRRALLGRALAIIYAERDTGFSSLMEWHNKASWLMTAAIIFIGFLASAAGGAVLFLAGAAGGFSSRLMRALRREDVPLDYGASWTTLFLSPIFGALAGWFGIALVTFATSPDINLLGDAFRRVDWYDPTNPVTLGIAFMMGFSERLFDAVTRAVELHAEDADERRKGPPPPAVRPPSDGGNPAPADGGGAAGGAPADAQLKLPTTATPISTPIAGTVILQKAAPEATEVHLTTTTPLFQLKPAILTIPTGETSGNFEVIALTGAKPGRVNISAHVQETTVEGTAEVV